MVSTSPIRQIPLSLAHPLDPLSANEIRQTVAILRTYVNSGSSSSDDVQQILFNSISLHEPNKYAVLLWAGTFTEKQIKVAGGSVAPLLRQAEVSSSSGSGSVGRYLRIQVHLIDPIRGNSFEAVVNLPSNLPNQLDVQPGVHSWKAIEGLLQPSLQPEELLWAEDVCKKDLKVKAACDAVGIAQESIAVDGKLLLHALYRNILADMARMVHWERRAIPWQKTPAMFCLCEITSKRQPLRTPLRFRASHRLAHR
jgi:primary-amine oxidase